MSTDVSKVTAWAMQMTHLRAARTFIEACEAEGIPVLPVKGIVSGRTLYDDPAERPLTDVDVRVVPRDVRRVAALCRRKGWRILQYMRSYANVVALVEGVAIDVEAHVGPPGMCGLTIAKMLEHATWSTALGFRCRWPDFTDHTVLLIVNAFKDKLGGAFRWAIRDLEVLPRRREYNPRALAARAREAGNATMTWVVADWMHRVRGVDEWRALRDAIRVRVPRPLYVSMLTARFEHDREGVGARILGRVGADAPLDRVRALLVMLIWGLESSASKLGHAPYVRGSVNPWDANEPARESDPQGS